MSVDDFKAKLRRADQLLKSVHIASEGRYDKDAMEKLMEHVNAKLNTMLKNGNSPTIDAETFACKLVIRERDHGWWLLVN